MDYTSLILGAVAGDKPAYHSHYDAQARGPACHIRHGVANTIQNGMSNTASPHPVAAQGLSSFHGSTPQSNWDASFSVFSHQAALTPDPLVVRDALHTLDLFKGSMSATTPTGFANPNAALGYDLSGGQSGIYAAPSTYSGHHRTQSLPIYTDSHANSAGTHSAWQHTHLENYLDSIPPPQQGLASSYPPPPGLGRFGNSPAPYNSSYLENQYMSFHHGLDDLTSMSLPSPVDAYPLYLPEIKSRSPYDTSPPYSLPSTASSSRLPSPRTRPSPLDRPFTRNSSPSGSSGSSPRKVCTHCQTTTTPLWRRDPGSGKPLCNACGLYVQQHDKSRPQKLIDADVAKASGESDDDSPDDPSGRSCSHCKATKTSVWRRCKSTQQLLCNACGVYVRLKGVPRPVSYKQKQVKPRMRHVERQNSTT